MGFSTSGSLLVIFVGLFIALGTMYTAASNTSDYFSEAASDQLSQHSDAQETRIDVTVVWHATEENLTIRVDNVGSTALSVGATSVLVDGEYFGTDEFDVVTVGETDEDGDTGGVTAEQADTDVWERGEQLRLENTTDEPERVKVVTGVGVAVAQPVTVAGIDLVDGVSLDTTGDGVDDSIEFDVTSTYDANVTLQDLTVAETETDATTIDHRDDPEVQVSLGPDFEETETTASGNFSIGETVVTEDRVPLGFEEVARYTVGEFRGDDGVVDVSETTVTVTIGYEDPAGVDREFTTEVST